MKCEELHDQYECDAYRTPVAITDDWAVWYEINKPDYLFEIWEYKDNIFTLIKYYDYPIEEEDFN